MRAKLASRFECVRPLPRNRSLHIDNCDKESCSKPYVFCLARSFRPFPPRAYEDEDVVRTRIECIKLVREVLQIGLGEAKSFCESNLENAFKPTNRCVAEELATRLTNEGWLVWVEDV